MMNSVYMTVPIEDTIIAYFDGRLNDADSAELLHRVSVSPEIRQIFQEHEALRQMSFRAARNAVISPELEESVFTRVAALREDRRRLIPIPFWSLPRISAVAGATAIVLLLAILAPWQSRNDNSSASQIAPIFAQASVQSSTSSPVSDIRAEISPQPVTTQTFAPASIATERQSKVKSIATTAPAKIIPLDLPDFGEQKQSASEPAIQIVPKPEESNHINMPTVDNPPQTMRSLRGLPDPDVAPMFEIGIASDAMPGFNAPADLIEQPLPVADLASEFAVRVGFNIDARNQIGLRFTRVSFPSMSLTATPVGLGYTVVNSSIESAIGYAEELVYKHREPVDQGLFYLTGSVGGGFYTLGTLFSCEAGLEVPVSDKLMGSVSVIVSRLHQNPSELNALLDNGPKIYEGANIYNTLAGRMEYGLSYRF
jgi:hypothetical protein